MKLLLSALLLLVCHLSLEAQHYARFDGSFDGWPDRVATHSGGPVLFQDDLLPNMRFGMERSEILEQVVEMEMQVTRSDDSVLEYSAQMNDGSFSTRAGFDSIYLRSISLELTVPDTMGPALLTAMEPLTALLVERAGVLEVLDGGTAYYHRTFGGVTIRTAVRITRNSIAIEAGPGEPAAGEVPFADTTRGYLEPIGTDSSDYREVELLPYSIDDFLPGIRVDMTQDDLNTWTTMGDWIFLRTRGTASEYQMTHDGLIGTLVVDFANARARSMSVEVRVSPEFALTRDQLLDPMIASLETRGKEGGEEGESDLHPHDIRRQERSIDGRADGGRRVPDRILAREIEGGGRRSGITIRQPGRERSRRKDLRQLRSRLTLICR